MLRCTNCGLDNLNNAKACEECGADLSNVVAHSAATETGSESDSGRTAGKKGGGFLAYAMQALGGWSSSATREMAVMGICLLLAFFAPWYIGEDDLPGVSDTPVAFSWNFGDVYDEIEEGMEEQGEALQDEAERMEDRADSRGCSRKERKALRAQAEMLEDAGEALEDFKMPLLLRPYFMLISGLILAGLAFTPTVSKGMRTAAAIVFTIILFAANFSPQAFANMGKMSIADSGVSGGISVCMSLIFLGLTVVAVAAQMEAFRARLVPLVRILAGAGAIMIIVGFVYPIKVMEKTRPLIALITKSVGLLGEDGITVGQILAIAIMVISVVLALFAAVWALTGIALSAHPCRLKKLSKGEHAGSPLATCAIVTMLLPLIGILFVMTAEALEGVLLIAFYLFPVLLINATWQVRIIAVALGTVADPFAPLVSKTAGAISNKARELGDQQDR